MRRRFYFVLLVLALILLALSGFAAKWTPRRPRFLTRPPRLSEMTSAARRALAPAWPA
jgi:hypothetical protein